MKFQLIQFMRAEQRRRQQTTIGINFTNNFIMRAEVHGIHSHQIG